MKTYLRFADLRDRGIIASWPMLKRRVDRDGFPPGKLAGPNTRIWAEDEIEAWLASRPTARKPAPRRKLETETAVENKTAVTAT
jgi:hypothetical protein